MLNGDSSGVLSQRLTDLLELLAELLELLATDGDVAVECRSGVVRRFEHHITDTSLYGARADVFHIPVSVMREADHL